MSHYFETPTAPLKTHLVQATIWGQDYEFTSANGVFSQGHLDLGTRVLLRSCDPPPTATRLLDLGCGFGAIAVSLAVSVPAAQVTAVDVNERALALTATNATRYGVADRLQVALPDQIDPTQLYDEIWSNPPIRIGKEALHQLLATWLPRLQPDGIAWLVVGKNLGADSLQNWLLNQGWDVERVASAKGYRVFRVRRPAAN